VTRSIKKWLEEPDVKLQDCFASTDWNMFRDSSDGIEEYTTSVTGFINKCIDDVVPTVTVRTYPNQYIPLPLSRSGTLTRKLIKKSRYALRRTIKQAKRQYRTKIILHPFSRSSLRTITDCTTASCPVTQVYQIS
jgi:hypothetical protein